MEREAATLKGMASFTGQQMLFRLLDDQSPRYCEHFKPVVRLSLSIPMNYFSAVTPGPIFIQLRVESSVEGGLKTYSNSHVAFLNTSF